MAMFKQIGKKWQARIRKTGHEPTAKNFATYNEAVIWAAKTETEMDSKSYADPRRAGKTTIGSLITRYIEEEDTGKGFGRNKRDVLRRLKIMLGDVPVKSLTASAINNFIVLRKKTGNHGKGAGGVTINGDITQLRTVLKHAKTSWGLPFPVEAFSEALDTMKTLKLKTKSKTRSRRPTDNELIRVKDFFKAKKRQKIPMWDIIDFAIDTTMRSSEITRIKWEDVDETNRTVIIRDRKDPQEKEGNDQVVPVLEPAWEILQAQPRTNHCIFPYSSKTISSIFPRACNELGIEDLHFHDLRHEGTARLFEDYGMQIPEVAVFTGHKDWKMLERYTDLKPELLHFDDEGNMRRAKRKASVMNFERRGEQHGRATLQSESSKQAVAILAVSGITPSDFALDLLKRVEDGNLTHQEAREQILLKYKVSA